MQAFLDPEVAAARVASSSGASSSGSSGGGGSSGMRGLARRVIACLDVRGNDNGDLVVTKVGACSL
jgi:hypothetical protein